ncbi:MAG: bifunctional adenosylcobinamide kinase/adenosylcobinamide-phosphate guanylyltransferase, partial [Mycobacteriales bacterium]
EEAERRLLSTPGVVYVATGPPQLDAEWAGRVAEHRSRRPPSWCTRETTDVTPLLAEPGPPLLVDSLTLWLTAHLDHLPEATDGLVAAWRDTVRTVVGVTDEVGSGVHPATALGRRFRDELGRLNARLAAVSDEVWLVTAGIAQRLR